jgi:DhnA family fructose-bisphosphate aldolase class Ia
MLMTLLWAVGLSSTELADYYIASTTFHCDTYQKGARVTGADVRLGRLFNAQSGRTFMIAFDRTLIAGPEPNGVDTQEVLSRIVSADPDAVLISPGLLRQHGSLFAMRGAPAAVVRVDFPLIGEFTRGSGEHHRLICTPEEALRLGADAVVMLLIHGFESGRAYADNVAAVAGMATECRRVGIPLIVESVFWGSAAASPKDPSSIALACRVAAELGADMIKSEYSGDRASMTEVIRGCPVPVTVLGGPLTDSEALERDTADALAAGARGVIYGRNVWQHVDTRAIAKRIANLVHGHDE